MFVHGFQNDHSAWRPLIERLDRDRYRFTSFDLVGCGASSGADTWERCTIDEYSGDLVALCEALDIEHPGGDRPQPRGRHHAESRARSSWEVRRDRARRARFALVSTSYLSDESFETLVRPTHEQQVVLAKAAFRRPPSDDEFRGLMAVIEQATQERIEGAARLDEGIHVPGSPRHARRARDPGVRRP